MTDSRIAARKQRWVEFLDVKSTRRVAYLIRYCPELKPRPLPNPDLVRERIEWSWEYYEYHMKRMDWLEDDTIPCLDMLTGTEIFAEAFGCRILHSKENNPAPYPMLHSVADAEAVRVPSLDVPPLRRLFEMADELYRRAGPGAMFHLVDMQCPLDVAAMMWSKMDFYPAMVKAPQAVIGLVEKVSALQFAFLDEWFRRYGSDFIAHYPDYYMPQGVTFSIDEIGAVNSKMFTQFFTPHLNQFSERYGGLGIHCCAKARHQWENVRKLSGLRMVNFNHSKIELTREVFSFFADTTAQWNNDESPQWLSPLQWRQEVPANAHMVIDLFAETKELALQYSEQLRKYTE
jgi:hypothetical protein